MSQQLVNNQNSKINIQKIAKRIYSHFYSSTKYKKNAYYKTFED